jgi:Spy/CpxP family protein refolding chaperone
MHASFWSWRHARHAFPKFGGCCVREGGCDSGGRPRGGHGDEGFEGGGGGGFGIRRPLRFLAHQLVLDDGQIDALARILDELKTERAQGEVDHRRTVTAFADALAGETFDSARAGEGGDLRVKSAERLRETLVNALQKMHALLKPDQRVRLAYLIRTGRLVI